MVVHLCYYYLLVFQKDFIRGEVKLLGKCRFHSNTKGIFTTIVFTTILHQNDEMAATVYPMPLVPACRPYHYQFL